MAHRYKRHGAPLRTSPPSRRGTISKRPRRCLETWSNPVAYSLKLTLSSTVLRSWWAICLKFPFNSTLLRKPSMSRVNKPRLSWRSSVTCHGSNPTSNKQLWRASRWWRGTGAGTIPCATSYRRLFRRKRGLTKLQVLRSHRYRPQGSPTQRGAGHVHELGRLDGPDISQKEEADL